MAFTLDWSELDLSGDNILSDGGDTVTATISRGGDGTGAQHGEFRVQNNAPGDMPDGILSSDLVNDGGDDLPSVTVDFDTEVFNIAFTLYDIDEGSSWDDLVGLRALDADGNSVAITITAADGQTVTGPDADGFYYIEGEVQDNAELGSVTVSIAGPVASLTINFNDGPDVSQAGYIGVSDFTFDDCFVRGTLIETKRGEIAVEDLVEGDLIRTMDNGFQPIRWIGSTVAPAMGDRAPILFKKGAINNSEDLYLSPWHRIQVSGWKAQLLFGENELLVAAKYMVNDDSIVCAPMAEVNYFHLMFDRHEIVFSNGAPTESYHPCEASLDAKSQATRDEIFELFPELKNNFSAFGPAARSVLGAQEAVLLAP